MSFVGGTAGGAMGGQTFGGGPSDMLLQAYDSAGALQWTRLAGSGGSDEGTGTAVDVSNNAVYLAGWSSLGFDGVSHLGGQADCVLVRYDLSGTRAWTVRLGSAGDEWCFGVAVDPSGNVLVVGRASAAFDGQTFAGGNDLLIAKFSSAGARQWTRLIGSTGDDLLQGVATDSSGAVYCTGSTDGGTFSGQTASGGRDIVVVKLDASGNQVWLQQFGTATHDLSAAVAMSLSGSHLYVTGYVGASLDAQAFGGGSIDLLLTKLDSSTGSRVWTRLAGSTGSEQGFGLTVDANDDVIVAGDLNGAFDGWTVSGASDALALKYSAAGSRLWSFVHGGTGADSVRGAGVDVSGNLYMAGVTDAALDGQTFAGTNDVLLLKLTGAAALSPCAAAPCINGT